MNTVTIEMLRRMGAEALSGVTFLNNPEFLREGVALDDFINSDRIVIGTVDGNPERRAEELYGGLMFLSPLSTITLLNSSNIPPTPRLLASLALPMSFRLSLRR